MDEVEGVVNTLKAQMTRIVVLYGLVAGEMVIMDAWDEVRDEARKGAG